MKQLIEKIIRLRNPLFKFDTGLNTTALIEFILLQSVCLLRGARMYLFLKKPKLTTDTNNDIM